MSDRFERAKFLGEQLSAAMLALANATRSTDVVLFLDRLARLEAYDADEIGVTDGLGALIAEALAARDEHAAELGAAAGRGLDLERFLETGRHLPADDVEGERDGWLRDLLVIATVRPWLIGDRAALATRTIERALAMIEADAEGFLGASAVAADRWEYESPDGFGVEAREVIAALGDLPLLVVFQREPAQARPDRVDRALSRAGRARVEAADDAISDSERRRAPPRELRLPRRAAQVEELYAADAPDFALCRMEAGVWAVRRRAGRATMRWHADPAFAAAPASVEVLQGAETGMIAADEHGEFALPASAEPVTLRLRVGSDSRVVQLDPVEG